ncbi:hypothetical protein CCH79_00005473 [Gambusia affinis]|uniref:Uncharacterized protein n=1 Tax=Gambusia affinis TaxID=33528 RepID=A0A315VQ13_GAMAF|nr:hypothetical protein CCH79_00005473 [Gambusia affinis]
MDIHLSLTLHFDLLLELRLESCSVCLEVVNHSTVGSQGLIDPAQWVSQNSTGKHPKDYMRTHGLVQSPGGLSLLRVKNLDSSQEVPINRLDRSQIISNKLI